MADNQKTGKTNISHSVQCIPVVQNVAQFDFLSKTLVLKVTEYAWVEGAPMPILQGSMSPNEQAITLLAGFASGSVTMEGNSIKHLPSIPDKSIMQTLDEVWGTPTQEDKDAGNIIYANKARITQKEPRKFIAWQVAEENPHTTIPDSECTVLSSGFLVPYFVMHGMCAGLGELP